MREDQNQQKHVRFRTKTNLRIDLGPQPKSTTQFGSKIDFFPNAHSDPGPNLGFDMVYFFFLASTWYSLIASLILQYYIDMCVYIYFINHMISRNTLDPTQFKFELDLSF